VTLKPVLRLYDYAASANCFKVRLLLAQLGTSYERVPVDIFAGETLTDEYGVLNPARSTPVLQLPDGRVVLESAAMLVYLADDSALWPDDAFERAEVIRWLVYEQAEIIPATGGLRFRLATGRLVPGDPDAQRRRQAGEEVLALLDRHLESRRFLVADRYSIADIAVFGYVHVADEAGYDMASYPHVSEWLERVRSQPGYMNDLEPYPPNAAALAGRSIYG
jgi:glutathione S-transferase